jgi:CBS domain-containing protein
MEMQMVSEVMTRNVQFVSPQETLQRAAQMMDDLNVGALPVCDGERLVGMVTDRDITVRASSAGIAPQDAVVDDVMSTDVRWCFEDQPLDEVMQQMSDTQIRRVPVVSHDDAHKLIGIVSLGDIATRTGDDAQKQDVEQVVEKVSFPSEPDRPAQGGTSGTPDASGIAASGTGTATGLAGSDVLDDRMNPDVETSSTGDPSDAVEVTPDDLVNKNALGSKTLHSATSDKGMVAGQEQQDVIVRHTTDNREGTATGETGTSEGIDAAGVSGASGGTAGTSGSPGTGIGAKP